MSLRPRNAKNADVPAFGSMYSTAIDFKTEHGPQEPVGVKIINNRRSGATFVVEMYYGLINDDIVQIDAPSAQEKRHLRFKINLLQSRSDRRQFANRIATNIAGLIQSYGFMPKPVESDAYVCGSAANSFYALAFVQSDSFPEYDKGFEALASAIATVKEDENFVIDADGYFYAYKLQVNSSTQTSMLIRRAGPAP
jgi:hypothetical protein